MPIRKRYKIKTAVDKTNRPSFMVFLRRFYKSFVAVVGLIIFFLVYNTYIVDHSILDLQFALQQTANAQTVDDIQGLDMILDALLLKEVANQKLDTENVIDLEFARNTSTKADILNQSQDIKFMLSKVLNKKKKYRNRFLVAVDGINELIIKTNENIRNVLVNAQLRELVKLEPDENEILKARELEAEGKIESAVKVYEEAFKDLPQYQGLKKVRLGFLYQGLENFNKARIIYLDVVKNAPNTQASGIARRLIDQLKDLEGLARRDKLVLEAQIQKEVQPEKLQELCYKEGAVKSLLRDFAGAELAYKKAVDFGPATDIGQKAKFNLGFNYKMQTKFAAAEKVFRQLSEEFPKSELGVDAQYWTADSLVSQAKYEEGIEEFQKVAENFKDMPIARTALFRAGYTYAYEINDLENAKVFFERIKQEFAKSDIAEHVDAEIISDMGSIYRNLGFKLMLQGKWEEAIRTFDEALKFNSTDARSYGGIGSAKGLTDQWEEALQKARKAVELAPNDSFTSANLGFLYLLQNNYDAALEVYIKAVFANSKYADAYYNLGWLYQKKGQFDKAIDAYKKAINYKPGLAMAYNNLGVCYWSLGRYEDASRWFASALKLDQSLPEAHYNMALAHFLFGRLLQAEAEAKKALELTADIPEAKSLLDIIRQKMQEKGQR